jgi:glutathione S-transferase
MSYLLFYSPGAASFCVHWMLIELGVPFDVERVDLKAGDQRSERFMALNPQARVPVLVVDGEAYAESAALLMLLADRHSEIGWAPQAGGKARDKPGDAARARWTEAMVWLANNLAPAMRDLFYAEQDGGPEGADAVRRLAARRIESAWASLDAKLSDGRSCLLGQAPTTADLLAVMLMRWSRNMPRPATDWPHIAPYVTRLRARPAFAEVCGREGLTDWLNPLPLIPAKG